MPTNTPGIRGYTYPNPIRLEAEDRTYLFWRGGNYNPTFSIQNDGETTWSAARTLISMPGERPMRSTTRAAATRSTWRTRTPTPTSSPT